MDNDKLIDMLIKHNVRALEVLNPVLLDAIENEDGQISVSFMQSLEMVSSAIIECASQRDQLMSQNIQLRNQLDELR